MASVINQVRTITLPSDQDSTGRTLAEEEIELVADALRSGVLTSVKGKFVKQFEQRFADFIGTKHAFACSSGSAAIHCAIAALDPEPGDEFVTTSITDMGALTTILYQGAIPVFAEVDPYSLNVTADTIAPCLSERTRGIIVTHLFGKPCDMEPILRLAEQHHLPVIEDCAQSFGAKFADRYTGTFGSIGCFSTQQGKHITTGEGGLVVTDDDQLARRIFLFINKAWGYGDSNPDHYFLALNYRMTELQGAVAVAQLEKLHGIVESRVGTANLLTTLLAGIEGIAVPEAGPGTVHTYWKYILNVDSTVVPGGALALADCLKQRGISSAPRYIQKPAFECAIFREQKTFGKSRFPFSLARPEALRYDRKLFPKTIAALEGVLVLPWNERYTREHVEFIAESITECLDHLCH